jgi:hypothetical protein
LPDLVTFLLFHSRYRGSRAFFVILPPGALSHRLARAFASIVLLSLDPASPCVIALLSHPSSSCQPPPSTGKPLCYVFVTGSNLSLPFASFCHGRHITNHESLFTNHGYPLDHHKLALLLSDVTYGHCNNTHSCIISQCTHSYSCLMLMLTLRHYFLSINRL